MPPSRTRCAPASERQQRFRSTVLRLNVLAKANGLQGLADAVVWAEQISKTRAAVANACTVDDGDDGGSYHELLKVFYLAVSNGQKQLVLNWPPSASPAADLATCDRTFLDAVVTYALLSRALYSCRHLKWYQQEHKSKEVELAIGTGFLQNFPSLIGKLLSALLGTAAQHTASMQRPCRFLAIHQLELWCYIFDSWPGCKLTDSYLTATIEPAAGLALALMRAAPTDIKPSSSNNSRNPNINEIHVHMAIHVDEVMRFAPCQTIVCFAHGLLCVVRKECCAAPYRSNHQITLSSDAAAALASADVQRLLLFGLAATSAVMHRQQAAGSTPPAASGADRTTNTLQQGQQHADHGYVQLLVALEILDGDQWIDSALKRDGPSLEEAFSDPQFYQCMFLVVVDLYRSFCHHQQKDDSSSAGTSSTLATAQDGLSIPTLLQQLALPVRHTLKDLALLLPDDDVQVFGVVVYVYGSISQLLTQLNRLCPQELQQVLQWLLQPLYHKMCKSLRTLSQQQQATNSSESTYADCEPTRTWALALQMFLALSELTIQDYLLGAIKQDLGTSLAAVEAVARIRSDCITSSQQPLVHPAYRVSMAVLTALSSDSNSEKPLACPAATQRLLSLILCQLKLVMLISAAPQTISAGNDGISASETFYVDLENISKTLYLLIALDQQRTSPQQMQPSDMTEAALHAWLAVMGKAMYATAVSLLKRMPIPHSEVCYNTEAWVEVAHYGSLLALIAVDDDGKAVLAESDELLGQLTRSIKTPLIDGTADAEEQESSRQVLQQLQQCGSAICAAFPVKFCCNNPACVNLAKLSEQQLVAGKGSRCSGCKVARYCSRECQLKHWKQHKQACKRLQAEAAIVEGSS